MSQLDTELPVVTLAKGGYTRLGILIDLEGDGDCVTLLQTIAATRGALNGLMA